ncbi:MAG: PHB depolymerase family esterase, partial [Jannaschia sp.]
MTRHMTDILGMVRDGRLSEATATIQARLRGDAAGPESDATDRPMKDVTPTQRALPDPAAKGRSERRPKPKPRPAQARGGKAAPGHPDGSRWENLTGALPARLYTPSAPTPGAPLIVMLHGCTQNPEDFAAGTRMNVAAEAIGAHVLWPEQTRANNANGCWNWFEPGHQGRTGEARAIAGLAGEIATRAGVAAPRIHVAGLSAGGAMAAILGARYPEVFASVGIHSGLPVGSARDVSSALGAMRSGAAGTDAPGVPAIVFHGLADRTVVPANGRAILGGTAERSSTEENGGRRVTVTSFGTSELWEVESLGHAWSGGDR